MKRPLNQSEKLILLYVGIFCGCLIIFSIFWRNNQYYSSAYAPMIEKAQHNREIEAQNKSRTSDHSFFKEGVEPRPAGFKEREIEKEEGERFKTF